MKKIDKVVVIIILTLYITPPIYAYSARNHFINMGRNLVETIGGPLYGIFVKGPEKVKKAYKYEVYELEKPEKRNQLKSKIFGLWRAPGEEAKAIIDGSVDSVKSAGNFLKEFISIFFSD